jgi:excinuclease ABC subunit C
MQNLQNEIKSLPDAPGIYQYFDKDDRLLYIGKAKSLKKRVKSYFRFNPTFTISLNQTPRIINMLNQTKRLNYILVDSEHDALILENSLIKQLRPKYNILLRDDKTYPYIYIDLSEDFPRFEITRKVKKGKNIKYFGPYSSSARDIYDSIYELFSLVQKKGSLKNKKLCLFYQIKRCLGPCEDKISSKEYKKIVYEAIEHINSKKLLISKLENKMYFYASKLLFEEAGELKNRIEKIKNSQYLSNIDLAKLEDYDVFAIYLGEKSSCGVRIFIRDGKVISSSHSIFRTDCGFDKDEIYKRLLLEYYKEDIPIVKNILVYEDFEDRENLERLFSKIFNKNITINIPKIGEKRRLTSLAYKNALDIQNRDKSFDDKLLYQLKELLNLQKTPYIIEGYDNSHLQGEATVGAVIKWQERFIKKEYRHYNLESRDEYSQMREMITRRVESFDKNPPPDLMVIDGGATLLKLAKSLIKVSGANVDIVAVAKEKRDSKAQRAKGKANDIIYFDENELRLPPSDKRLQFLQTIRDESHRFVINYHRKQKLKADNEISLLKQKGIGEATIKKLLQYFETFSNIKSASLDELESVVGIKIAKKIKNI